MFKQHFHPYYKCWSRHYRWRRHIVDKMADDMERFVEKSLNCITLEKEAEIERLSEHPSTLKSSYVMEHTLYNVYLIESENFAYDRVAVTFGLKNGKNLPEIIKFSIGERVAIGEDDSRLATIQKGVILRFDKNTITVIIDKIAADIENIKKFFIVKCPSERTYLQMEQALKKLSKKEDSPIVKIAFGNSGPQFKEIASVDQFRFMIPHLNSSQKDAVVYALASTDCFIIHGPPGTGKTMTLVEIILQLMKKRMKVLVCAGSNAAVDNIAFKVWEQNKDLDMVRIGHIARLNPLIHEVSLDAKMAQCNSDEIINEMKDEIKRLDRKIDEEKDSRKQVKMIYDKKVLSAEVWRREKSSTESVIKKAKLIFSTVILDSIMTCLREDGDAFDVVVIDECSQILEPACWVSLLDGKRCILAGDHRQLSPVVISDEVARLGFGTTLMDRLIDRHGGSIMKMLNVQYRMNNNIMAWSSNQFYDNKLVAHHSVSSHLLRDLPDVEEDENTSQAIVVIDTVATDCVETIPESSNESRGNKGEVDIVARYVDDLIDCGVKTSDIGVISPYSLQVNFLRQKLNNEDERYKGLEIKTVDGFQGREKEAIVVSLVRSNSEGACGFLADERRINVAVTRARRHLAIICNSKTVSSEPIFKSLLDYVKGGGGEIRSAKQYEDVIGVYKCQARSSEKKKNATDVTRSEKKHSKSGKKTPLEPKKTSTNTKYVEDDRSKIKCNNQQLQDNDKMDDSDMKKTEAFYECPQSCLAENCSKEETSKNDGKNESFVFNSDVKGATGNECTTSEQDTKQEKVEENICAGVVFKKNEFLYNGENSKGYNGVHHQNQTLFSVVPNSLAKTKKKPKSELKHSHNAAKPKVKDFPPIKDEDDLDAILASFKQAEERCSLMKCTNRVVLYLPSQCDFCKRLFCSSHSIPEIHGCGADAKARVRSQIRKDGKIYPGSGKPERKLDADKKNLIHRQLEKKLDEFCKQRKVKPKKK